MGEVYDAHARTFDRHGLGQHRLNACGYSLGSVYAPSWMDWPMFYEANPVETRAGHGLLPPHDPHGQHDRHRHVPRPHLAIGATGAEVLSKAPLELVVRE